MKTLFLLDGFDEVASDLDGDRARFLGTLLNQSNIILTSRPHARLPFATNLFNLELETIGFYPEQVDEYISGYFPAVSGLDKNAAITIRAFLRGNRLVQSLVRIPVQLDALCYTWDDFSGASPPETMSSLYQEMAQKLWKKDVVKLGKIFESRARDLTWGSIKSTYMKTEIECLEALGFDGLCTETIDFDADYRDDIIERLARTGNALSDDLLPRLSFLRTSDPSIRTKDRQYHFLHLTFQEYFTASYFVKKWTADEKLEYRYNEQRRSKTTSPKTFLQEHKYNVRYNMFWRFVAGLMDLDGEIGTIGFFEAIQEEPRDILGPAHQRLVMGCLSEVILSRRSSTFSQLQSKLEEQHSCLLVAECKLTGWPSLAE
jgi:predicted NACHT family NTPase